jgi:glycerate kinase
MRVLVAPDKFAGTLSAVEAAEAIRDGWLSAAPHDDVACVPLADGGPGFVEVLAASLGGDLIPVPTIGPLGDSALGLVLVAEDTAYVESAQACGLHLLPAGFTDVERPDTAGVADLLIAALDAGVSRVVVGVGGSGTTDGGRGMVERFLQQRTAFPDNVTLEVATDVDNTLLGPLGAAPVFGPQKGADADAVDRLEARLANWLLDTRGADGPGAGAGGGLGYGLFLLGGRRVSGIETCLAAVGFDDHVAQSDLVITGEGSFDFQSLRGKVIAGVAFRAAAKARPCLVLAGRCDVGRREASAMGVDEAWSVVEHVGSVDLAMSHPHEGLTSLAAHVAGLWSHD